MVCPKCGNRKNPKNICSNCGYKIDSPIKIKTYDDEEVVVDAPIITESHTFIDEDDFQESLQKHLEQEEIKQKNKKKLQTIKLLIVGIIILGTILALFVIPKVLNKKNNEELAPTNSNEFSSKSWENGEIKIDGIKYRLKEKYSTFVANSWTVDLEKYGYADGYILNDGDKTSTTILLNNQKYQSAIFQVGFINSESTPTDIKDCSIWSITINNDNTDIPIPFELPGGIKTGSTKEDITNAYGEIDENKIYRSEEGKYTTYHYQSSYNSYLDLYVYDEKGLMEINLKKY